jgi:hypothetical protein
MSVRGEISEHAFAGLDRLEEARAKLWTAASSIARDCARG